MPPRILILCTGNSCRSQMAQGYLHQMLPDATVFSAGVTPHKINPLAIEVMAEDGVDISYHTSDHVDTYLDESFDLVITVCDHARQQCPIFPGNVERLHRDFPDPSEQTGSKEQVLPAYRKTRDAIKGYMRVIAGRFVLL